MEDNILALLKSNNADSKPLPGSDVKLKQRKDVISAKQNYPLGSRKVSVKKTREQNNKNGSAKTVEPMSRKELAEIVDGSFEDAEMCKKLIEVMKQSGGQQSSRQQLNEKHLSHVLVHLLDLMSSDLGQAGSQLQALKPWVAEAQQFTKLLGDKTSKSSNSTDQDLVKNVALGVLGWVYAHEINKDLMTKQLNEQIVKWMSRGKNCDLMGGYRMLFQSLLLSLETRNQQNLSLQNLLSWFDTLSDLYFVHINLMNSSRADKNEQVSTETVQIIDIIQEKLQQEIDLIKNQKEILGQLEFLEQNQDVLAGQLFIELAQDGGSGDIHGMYMKEEFIV